MTTSDPSYDFAVGTSFDPNAGPGAHAQRPAPPPPAARSAAGRSGAPRRGLVPADAHRALPVAAAGARPGGTGPAGRDVPAWLVLGYSELSYVTTHDELFARDSRRWNQWTAFRRTGR